MLANEKETLGFYVSSHPLEKWRDWSTIFITATTTSIKEARQYQRIVLAGLVQSVRTIVVRSGRSAGQKMAIVTFEDIAGTCETVLFTDCYNKFAHLVEQDAMIFVLGRIDLSRGDPQVIVERIVPIDGVPLQPGRLCLRVNGPALNGSGKSAVTRAAELLGSRGNPDSAAAGADAFPVDLVVDTEHGRAVLQTPVRTTLSPDLIAPLTAALGPGCIRITRGVWLDADERRKDNRSRRPIAT
jgi:DNA polymerase-3 subunit alpha